MSITALCAPTQVSLSRCVARLAQSASIEMSVNDLEHVEASKALLPAAKKIYVTHLPKQRWENTIAACRILRVAGFDPVAHIPVRLLASRAAFDDLLESLRAEADIHEVLLISGDYAHAVGPYSSVLEALQTDCLQKHAIPRVSLAGHPEGHPRVAPDQIRRAEIDKALYCRGVGLEATLVSQFCFEAQPFVDWARELRAAGVAANLIAGVAAPAKLSTLVSLGLRCGVGRSIRALSAKPGVLSLLMAEHSPDDLIDDLAEAIDPAPSAISGLHVFCFGGWLRACAWLQGIAVPERPARRSLYDRSL